MKNPDEIEGPFDGEIVGVKEVGVFVDKERMIGETEREIVCPDIVGIEEGDVVGIIVGEFVVGIEVIGELMVGEIIIRDECVLINVDANERICNCISWCRRDFGDIKIPSDQIN